MENKDQIIHAINAFNAQVTQKTEQICQDPDSVTRNLVTTLATSVTALVADAGVNKAWRSFSAGKGWDTSRLVNRMVSAAAAGAVSAALSVLVTQLCSAIFNRRKSR